MSNTNLSGYEISLCVAALDCAADYLTGGLKAATRRGVSLDAGVPETARKMRELRNKLIQR